MKKALFLSLIGLFLMPIATLAHGDGYTGCEQDPVYERDFYAIPNLGLNLRTRACMSDSPVIHVLQKGQEYKVIAETDGWYKIRLDNGTTGWAGSSLMTATTSNTKSTKLSNGYSTVQKEEKEVTTDAAKEQVRSRVKGYILLQVEDAGQAYYVNPDDENGYYMKDGATAYEMMRSFGLGISNADLNKILAGNYSLTNRLRGKIVLAVHKNGEAYYIHPKDRSVHYLKNGQAAYKLMRELSLGVSNKDLNKITIKNKISKVKSSSKETVGASDGTISLAGSVSGNKVYLDWNVNGFTSDLGFKVVTSENENPVYPGNTYHYYSDSGKDSDTWSGLSAGTHHFRVCEYLGGACGVYSNDLELTIEGEESSDSSSGSISLSAVTQNGKVYLDWTVNGFYSDKGFKVVKSTEPNPVYPGDTYHYYSSPDKDADTWSGLTVGETYHFRVCEYLGGACGVYSNDLAVAVE